MKRTPTIAIKIEVYVAWWLDWWLYGVALACAVSGREPDMEKFNRVVSRALRVRVAPR